MALGYPNSVLVAYPTQGDVGAFIVPDSKQIWIYNARAFNNSGSAQGVGICRKLVPIQLGLYGFVAIGDHYNQIPLSSVGDSVDIFDGTDDDGFVVQSLNRFNLIGMTIDTGEDNGVYVYEYWNGTDWTSLTTLQDGSFDSADSGDNSYIAFRAPVDWVPGGPAGLDPFQYSIRVTSSTAPDAAVSIDDFWVGEFLEYYDQVPNNAAVQLSFPDTKPFLLNGGEEVFPFFQTANAANQFGCYYTIHA